MNTVYFIRGKKTLKLFPLLRPWGNRMNVKFFNNDIPDGEVTPSHKESEDREDDIPIDFARPGGSFPRGASPYGVMDMMGSVFEFCSDWYGLYRENYENFAVYEPKGPESGQNKIMKGGGNCDDLRNFRISNRDMAKPGEDYCDYGFRMAMSPEEYGRAWSTDTTNTEKEEAAVKNYRDAVINLKDDSPILLLSPHHSREREGISLNPVSIKQYKKFLKETGYKPLSQSVRDKGQDENTPVLPEKRDDAQRYCQWAGGKLPKETGMEKFRKIIIEPGSPNINKTTDINSFGTTEEWTVNGSKNSGDPEGRNRGKSFRVFFPRIK